MHYFVRTELQHWGQAQHDLHEAMQNAQLRSYTLMQEQCSALEEAMYPDTEYTSEMALRDGLRWHRDNDKEMIKFEVTVVSDDWEFAHVCGVTGTPSYRWAGSGDPVDFTCDTYRYWFNTKTGEITVREGDQ